MRPHWSSQPMSETSRRQAVRQSPEVRAARKVVALVDERVGRASEELELAAAQLEEAHDEERSAWRNWLSAEGQAAAP